MSPSLSIHVVFGRVVSGQQYVNEIESQKVDANHRPYADVRISNSGELVLLKGELDYAPLFLCVSCVCVCVCDATYVCGICTDEMHLPYPGGKSKRAKVELSTDTSSQESSSSSSEESSSSESSGSSEEEVKKKRKQRRREKPALEKGPYSTS